MLTGKEVSLMVEETPEKIEKVQESDDEPIKIMDLNLSTRLTNALLRSGYDDLRKLEGLTEEEIAGIRGMGNKSYTELMDIIKKHNIKVI
jgi:DNA-directed RNA polymerase alpha subunit